MLQQVETNQLTKVFQEFLEEEFEKVSGIFLDARTSLLETLENISAEEASKRITETGTSIASQVDHLRFYLKVSNDYMDGKKYKADWQGSWKRKTVTEEEWDLLRQQVREDYDNLIARLKGYADWSDDDRLGGQLGIIVHTAYHLGAIRQILRVAKG